MVEGYSLAESSESLTEPMLREEGHLAKRESFLSKQSINDSPDTAYVVVWGCPVCLGDSSGVRDVN